MKKSSSDGRKRAVIYWVAVAVCIILPVVGYFGIGAGEGGFYAPADGSHYYSATVTDIVDTFFEYGEGGELLSSDTVFSARLTSGEMKGEIVEVYQNYSSYTPFNPKTVEVGDRVIVARFDGVEEWNFIDFVRADALLILALLFALMLVIFGRKKGLKTVLSLSLTLVSIFFVFMPAILLGGNIYFWAVAVCVYMIFMTLIITDGVSAMSLSASIGCTGGVLASLLVTFITDAFINITGNADPHAIYLLYIGEGLDVRALIYASIIIGSVGAVMDVAVDISASLKELAQKLERPTMKELFTSGINIGRDVIGTMSNTLVLAYIGGSMCSLLLYFYNNYANAVYLFNIEIIVVELLQILVGSMGILLTLPLTALVSAYIYTKKPPKPRCKGEKKSVSDEFCDILESAGTFGEIEDEKK